MPPLRIAFGYKKFSGKSTAAKYLAEKFGGKVISFASPLKDIMTFAQQRCGLPLEKDRKFLQLVGTEWGRNTVDDDLWLNIAIDEAMKEDGNVFIDDVRFPNELMRLKEAGFTVVCITRDSLEEVKDDHYSETALIGYENEWSLTIENNGSLEDFYLSLNNLLIVDDPLE